MEHKYEQENLRLHSTQVLLHNKLKYIECIHETPKETLRYQRVRKEETPE